MCRAVCRAALSHSSAAQSRALSLSLSHIYTRSGRARGGYGPCSRKAAAAGAIVTRRRASSANGTFFRLAGPARSRTSLSVYIHVVRGYRLTKRRRCTSERLCSSIPLQDAERKRESTYIYGGAIEEKAWW